MKTITKISLMTVFALALTAPAVGAQSPGQRAEVNTTTAQSQPGNDADKQATFEQRTAERKERLQIKIDTAQSQRLKARCKNAQGKITSFSKRINGIQTSRQQKYSNLLTRMDRLVEQLQAKGLETAGIEQNTTELKQLIDAYETTFSNHVTALDDMTTMDCEADPEAFQAALVDARDSLKEIKTATITIKDYLNNEVKTELKLLRQSVVEKGQDEQPQQKPVSTDPNQPVSNEEEN